jgi:hypothetical protein
LCSRVLSDSSWTIIWIDIVGSDQVCVLYASSRECRGWERVGGGCNQGRVGIPVEVRRVLLAGVACASQATLASCCGEGEEDPFSCLLQNFICRSPTLVPPSLSVAAIHHLLQKVRAHDPSAIHGVIAAPSPLRHTSTTSKRTWRTSVSMMPAHKASLAHSRWASRNKH